MIVYEHGVRKHKVDEHEQQRGGQYLRSLLFHAAKLPRIREIRKRAGERPEMTASTSCIIFKSQIFQQFYQSIYGS